MAPVVIDLSHAEDPRDVVHLAVQALAEGRLVAFPTETVYGVAASALDESAVARLLQVKGRREGHPLTLAIKSADDAVDYVPDIAPLARRLARRCWPGPITLVLEDDHPDSAVQQLPESVQQAVSPNGTIGLRVPAHPVLQSVLRLSAGPLVLSSANRSGQGDAVTAKEVVQTLGGDIELVIDDGRCKFAQPSSVVRVHEGGFEVLRAGVFSETALKRLSGLFILLVCTGNTCRSPMAEAMMKKKVADKLGCKPQELEDRGIMIASAGIAAMAGGRSATEAVQAMRERELEVSQHESQPLSERLARHADLVITMTHGHRDAVIAQWPDAAPRTFTLCVDGRDVADPIGGPIEWYRRCADEIDKELDRWVEEIDFTTPAFMKTK